MKASKIIAWICNESIDGEFINIINVPSEDDEFDPQNEEWWINTFGAYPPCAINEGTYLYMYNMQIDGEDADAEIELPTEQGFESIYLYRVDE